MTTFHDDLQCHVEWLSYSFETKVLVLVIQAGNCTDMSGAIRLAKRVDSDVERIVVIGGDAYDIAYNRIADNWKSEQL